MPQAARPTSPHLQIYRWPLSMVLSILHRVTGVALVVGTLLLVAMLLALASGPESYARVRGFSASWLGLLLLFGWSWALCFHLCNGIRHLFWDVGYGYSIQRARLSGVAVIVISATLTALIWACVIAQGGVP
ncbi:MAG: succinate dehydrogenase, cytochrome b556 subunit [Rudaea sp.]